MSRVGRLLPIVAGVASLLPFLPALGAGFVNWDDEAMLVKNLDFRGLGLPRLRWMFTTTFFGHYSPFAWLSFGLNYVLGGLDPWGYHLANLLLHACNVALFAVVSSRLLTAALNGQARVVWPGTVIATLVFAIHPLRVESVAWVSERRDVLCGLFYLLAVLAYLRGVGGAGGRIAPRWWALSLAAFAGALLGKAIAMTLPLSLLVLDLYPLRRRALGWRALITEKLPYAVLGAAAAALAVAIRQTGGDITDYERYGVGARLALTGYGLWFYPWKLVWPTGLSPMYELPLRLDPGQWRFLGPGLAVIAVTVALLLRRRRWPGALAAWAHSAIVVLPLSGIVHSGVQLVHDRYSYLSGLGFAVLAGGAVAVTAERVARRGRAGVAALASSAALALVLGLGALTWTQTGLWRDSATLWGAALELDQSCSVCWSNLGRALLAKGRLAEAEAHVARALALRPDRPGPVENMGVIMLARGRHAEAESFFRRLVAQRPSYGPYRNNLGVALANQGRDREAEGEFREAQRLTPRFLDAHSNLATLYLRQRRYGDAITAFRSALALDPTHAGVRGGLARALRSRAVELVQEGQVDEAGRLWQEATRMAPDDGDLLSAIGRALVEKGRGPEALAALERAVALDPRRAEARFWLARAYRLAGKAPEADREVAALRDLAPDLAAELTADHRSR